MLKRWIALMLALMLCLGMFPATAFAEEEQIPVETTAQEELPAETQAPEQVAEETPKTAPADNKAAVGLATEQVASGACGENATWAFDAENGVLTISGTGEMKSYGTTSGAPWHSYRDSIKILRIEDGITTIGKYAFLDCVSLTEVSLPKGLITLDNYAFYGCSSLQSVTIPAGVTALNEGVFGKCTALSQISMHDGIEAIGVSAFEFCEALTTLTLPAGITTISNYAFCGCKNLTEIVLNNKLASLGENAFADCVNLREVILPESVTAIGKGAFHDCKALRDIRIPAGVAELHYLAFDGCDNLEAIWVDEQNLHYSSDAMGVLFDKNKTELMVYPSSISGPYTIPASVTAIGPYAFVGNVNLTGIVIPEGVTQIGEWAFSGCSSLPQIKLPAGVTKIGSAAFQGCSITEIEIPRGVSKLEWMVLGNCANLEKVTLHEGLTVVGTEAFRKCEKLTELVLPSTVTDIEMRAFMYCSDLKEITISAKISLIEPYAFEYCQKLEKIIFAGNAPIFEKNALSPGMYGKMSAIAYYPVDNATWTDEVMEGHYGVKKWIAYLKVDENYLTGGVCGEQVEWGMKKDGSLYIFGEGAMGEYSHVNFPWQDYKDQITSVTVAKGVSTVSDFAFYACENLRKVTLSGTVGSIGNDAFKDCGKLEEIKIPTGITAIGAYAFQGCGSLGQINIPATVTGIGEQAFSQCSSLTGIWVEQGNPGYSSDDAGALFNKNQTKLLVYPTGSTLITYAIPGTVMEIGEYAFRENAYLKKIIIPKRVSSIGNSAFFKCSALREILFEGNAPRFAEQAFYSAALTCYYLVNDGTWTDAVRQNYGGSITWTVLDNTINFGVMVDLVKKTQDLSIDISAKLPDSLANSIGGFFEEEYSDVTVHSALGMTKATKGKFSLPQSDAVRQDILLEREGYQTYIIPKAVSASFLAAMTDYTEADQKISYPYTAHMKLKDSSNKPYISTVFGRESKSNQIYRELQREQLNLEERTYHDIIITVAGAEGKTVKYYLQQDGKRVIESDTGVFSKVDLYTHFDFGKDVYAYAVVDGVSVKPVKLCVTKMAARSQHVEDFLKSTSFSLMGKDSQVIQIPEHYPLVGGGKISLEAFKSPIGISVDGSDVKISIGVDIFSGEKETDKALEINWMKFKKNFETLNKGVKDADEALERYRNFAKQYDTKNSKPQTKHNFDLAFLGYMEGTIVNGELILKEVHVNVKGKFTFRYTQQGAIWVVPAYFYVEAGAAIDLTVGKARLIPDKDIPMEWKVALGIAPELKLGGGVGVKGAVSGGIWGSGSLPYTNDFAQRYHKLMVSGKFGIEGEFFILKGELDLLSGDYMLFESYYGAKTESASSVSKVYASSGEEHAATVLSRDYGDQTSAWMGQVSGIAPLAAAETGVTFRTLQTGIFRQSQPQIVSFGDELIMVWVEDDTSRDAYNRMRLVYSLFDKETDTWSKPQAVCDDGRNDGYPSLISDGKTVYVAWQKIAKTLTATDCAGVDALLTNSEVYLAKFDTGSRSFQTAQQLTDNNLYEYALTVAVENGKPVVYYASVAGSQMHTPDAHTLYRNNGTEKVVDSKRNYILTIDAAKGQVCYCMDTDGDLSTTSDVTAYSVVYNATTKFQKEEMDGAHSFAAYGDLDGRNTLFVSDMTNIYYMQTGQRRAVLDASRSITGNINIVKGSSGTQIFWTETEDNHNALYSVTYEDGAWTKPVKISRQDQTLRDVCVTILDGKLVGVCNGDTEDGSVSLQFFTVSDFVDLDVSQYVRLDETALMPGREQSVEVFLRNLGTSKIEDTVFTISDGLGADQVVHQTLDLPAGGAQFVMLPYTVPENYANTTMTITAEVSGKQEADATNNTVSVEIGLPDLAVRENGVHSFADGYIIQTMVENNSLVNARDVSLAISLGEAENTPVHIQKIGAVERDTYANVQIAVPADKLIFDEAGVAKIYLRVSCSGADAADGDNTVCVLIYKPEHSHNYTAQAVTPTCGETGYTVYTCTCGSSYIADDVPATGNHSFTDEQDAICNICGYIRDVIPAPTEPTPTEPAPTEPKPTEPVCKHDWREATCKAPKTCKICGEKTGKPAAHTYDDNVDGTCNVCNIRREEVETRKVVHMFRMYNPNTGEHFYTGSEEERDNLIGHGWQYEGVGFTFPANTGAPVYRLFQPSTGEHLYTMDKTEKEKLEAEGWNYEGIAFNSAYDTEAVQHRLHNPNATVGAYHFTFSEEEKQNLIDAGWEYQGIGWYSCFK